MPTAITCPTNLAPYPRFTRWSHRPNSTSTSKPVKRPRTAGLSSTVSNVATNKPAAIASPPPSQARRHRKPADPGHRRGVHLAGSRGIRQADGGGQSGKDRDQCRSDGQRNNECKKQLHLDPQRSFFQAIVPLRQFCEK